jgi:hypothetical protein
MTTDLESILDREGLSSLLPIFTAQGVTDTILAELSDVDLRELGIDKLGERKRLLAAFSHAPGRASTASSGSGQDAAVEQSKASAADNGSPSRSTPQEQFTYEARHGEITITGFTGKGHVIVPDRFDDLDLPVRAIGEKAFCGNGTIVSVVLPEGITLIDCGQLRLPPSYGSTVSFEGQEGWGAFQDCSSMKRITLPESLTEIGDNAFSGCSSLTSITIPDGVTRIGKDAFSGCSSLTSITLPESLTEFGNYAFDGCKVLISVRAPKRYRGYFLNRSPVQFFPIKDEQSTSEINDLSPPSSEPPTLPPISADTAGSSPDDAAHTPSWIGMVGAFFIVILVIVICYFASRAESGASSPEAPESQVPTLEPASATKIQPTHRSGPNQASLPVLKDWQEAPREWHDTHSWGSNQ